MMVLAGLCGVLSPAFAAGSPSPSKQQQEEKSGSAREEALSKLKEAFQSGANWDEAVTDARRAGVPRQSVAELRLLYCVRSGAADLVRPLLIEMEELLPGWNEPASLIFKKGDGVSP